jgi:hypothetical protein
MNKNNIIIALLVIIAILLSVLVFKPKDRTEVVSQTEESTTTSASTPIKSTVPYKYLSSIQTKLPEGVGTFSDNTWPPVIAHSSTPYTCAPGAGNRDADEKTTQTVINGRTYCIHEISDGYAGGRGYTYTYTTTSLNARGTETTTFKLKYPSCSNYDEPQAAGCKTNQANFNQDLSFYIDSLMKS